MPRCVELELAVLGQADLLGAFPVLAAIVRAVHARAVEEVVRRGDESVVPWVDDRVIDGPALEQRPFDVPATPVVAVEQEEPLASADG
jgi:hypothetical protein